jgi:hypothetical protein
MKAITAKRSLTAVPGKRVHVQIAASVGATDLRKAGQSSLRRRKAVNCLFQKAQFYEPPGDVVVLSECSVVGGESGFAEGERLGRAVNEKG